MKHFLVLIFLILTTFAFSQTAFELDQQVKVTVAGKSLLMPFAGGINASQFQEMDVDNDGVEELIAWDINTRRVSVFKIVEDEITFLPEMSYYFPSDVNGFLVLADFDGDGKKDLFTSSTLGIKAYRNSTPTNGKFPVWESAQNFLRLDNGSNLQANNLDIPIIMDLDGDGDLDIATFNFASGDFLEFYLNTSVERKGVADIDGFAFPETRWGKFEFCGCGSFSFGITCSGLPISRAMDFPENQRILHSGGHSILYSDFDGDGIRDLLMGQDQCNTLYFLVNKGTNAQPLFDEFSTELPGLGPLPEFPIFHTSYLFQNQLLISSNSSAVAAQYQTDFANSIYQFSLGENTSLISTAFLQKEMLDLGENSRPFFRGNSSNGEMIITANSLQNGQIVGKASLFKVENENWSLQESDYLGLSNLGLTDLQYQEFVNSKNQNTSWFAGTDTLNFALVKKLFVINKENLAESKEVTIPVTGIRPMDHFEFFSYQKKDYLLLAKQTGELVLFDVDFAPDITIRLNQRDFLGFSDNPASRNLNVHLISGALPSLYVVDQRGVLAYLENFMNSNVRESISLRLLDNQTGQSRLSRNSWIAHIPKPFGENFDLVIGNNGGGLQYLKSISSEQIPSENDFLVKVFPNPSTGPFKIISSQVTNARLITSIGQVIWENGEIKANIEMEIDASILSPGLYILQLVSEKGQSVSKKIIIKD
ncbi:T9SS type A sorting domain-containing protein [Rhodonellum sp.]|uniref:T9SS type A sorting domain-containing protein n=1 Tax=Rhodonellum sp. TaxID=2231180 RepID=UPI00271574EC|nr:T9SS type A sorting domain-containing protein [Rhodonellum sp.]MDO9552076.1 FG-GAP-like repeat-containing protein [Rhodonellum sp.]